MSSENPFALALHIILSADPNLAEIVGLSLQVSGLSALLALGLGLPLGAFLAVKRFRGRATIIILFNAMLGLPPVVVGLTIYLLLSRNGLLGFANILYTAQAMVMAQFILVFPIAVALTNQLLEGLMREYHLFFTSLRLSSISRMKALLIDARGGLITIMLACLGRALSEVGAIIIVGGNINHVTRMMTTAIALETSRGELALAMALGIILLIIALVINIASQVVKSRIDRTLDHV
ncbi:MAG: ABC transporter permease [Candidatus Puniceispirillaceae bacterium]